MAKSAPKYMPVPVAGATEAQPKQPKGRGPIVAEPARNGCEARRSSIITDAAGNVTEYRTTPASDVENLTTAVDSLKTEVAGLKSQLTTLANQLRSPAQVRNVASPSYAAPTPYFDS